MKVKDLVKASYYVEPTTRLMEVANIILYRGLTIVPVCDDTRLVGIITDRDLVAHCLKYGINVLTYTTGEFMTLNPISIPSDMDIEEIAVIMSEAKVLYLPVVEKGLFLGVISMKDVARAIQNNVAIDTEQLCEISIPILAISEN